VFFAGFFAASVERKYRHKQEKKINKSQMQH